MSSQAQCIPGLVSTIIPVRNRPELLRESVQSVLNQTWPSCEIIICDDGSTDDTHRVARDLQGAYSCVRVLRTEGLGPGGAREIGRCAARGEFIQYLDSDDLFLPHKLQVQVEALRSAPDCDIAYGITSLINEEGDVLIEQFKHTSIRREQLFPALLVDRWWCTHTPLYRRRLTDRIGPWSSLRYSQDWLYDAKAGALGARLVFCDQLVSQHRSHDQPRQTGHGRWLEPSDQVFFFQSLFGYALKAGVVPGSPESLHFSRWVFAHARASAELGDVEAARALLKLATEAAGSTALDQRLFGLLAEGLGWGRISRLSALLRDLLRKRPGPHSLKQSWMEPGGEQA